MTELNMATGQGGRRNRKGYSANTLRRNQRIVLNIGGQRFHTYLGTLATVPHTRLCWMAERHPFSSEYDHANGEYFFDRNPSIFNEVINYYRTGQLHCPTHICASQFAEELAFWGINPQNMESCCWVHYRNHIKNEKSLQSYGKEKNGRPAMEIDSDTQNISSETCAGKPSVLWEKYKKVAWNILEKPNSTAASKVYVLFSSIFIIFMLLQFCLSSLPSFVREPKKVYILSQVFKISSIYFTLEIFIRFFFCPSKLRFFKSFMNWVDILTIIPFYVSLVADDERTIWLVPLKVLRLYRLFSLSVSFQIMLKAIVASVNELILGLGTIIIPVILFSCFVYLAEKHDNPEMFGNVPESFWWAIVTMTTLGYGDKVPATPLGKLIGITCALCGVVLIALPISVISNNFYFHYTHARTRKKKPSKDTIAAAMAHLPLMNLKVLGSTEDSRDSDLEYRSGDETSVQGGEGANGSKARRKRVAIPQHIVYLGPVEQKVNHLSSE